MSKATVDVLAELHAKLAEKMKAKLESGEATAADFAAIAKFLKDNGIEADLRNPNTPAGALAKAAAEMSLPFPGEVPLQ